ncbi:hypothetical protein RA279_29295, partial [Pseudomonas syringae pv. tagetis]|uniref:hypothetical protein n=1 Tax=Pseudomonas syringae group genomosp. 7 TaxID=251699 RepID=UPI00376F8210
LLAFYWGALFTVEGWLEFFSVLDIYDLAFFLYDFFSFLFCCCGPFWHCACFTDAAGHCDIPFM